MGLRQFFGSTTENRSFKISRSDVKVRNLGSGISGSADLFKTRQNQLYVVKAYYGRDNHESKAEYKERVLHEYEVLKQLQHQNIIQAYSFRVSFSKISIYLEAGSLDLQVLLKQLPLSRVNCDEMLCFWRQLCHGVEYIHSLDYCHRDLKLSNFVFDPNSGLLKIIDWATACKVPNNKPAVGLVGSKGFAAPETFSSISYDGKSTDIWSLGICLYFMLHKKLPWKTAQHSDEEFSRFKAKETRQEITSQLPGEKVTSQTLEVDPSERVSIKELVADSWFQGLKYCGEHPCGTDHSRVFNLEA